MRTAAIGYARKYGKKVRLVSAESAQKGPIQPAIAAGIIEPWWIDNADFPFERVNDAVQGAWPLDPNDPISPVVPAFIYKYEGRCSKCQTLVYQGEKAPAVMQQPCPKCKQLAPPVLIRATRQINPENGIDKVGMYLFEGGTAFGDMFMDNMSERSAKGDKIGEDVAVRFRDGKLDIAGSSRSSYGIAQRRVKTACNESRHLPVDYNIWTFTKEMGTDDNTRQSVFGPKLPGSAATADVPRWFGPTLSAAVIPPKNADGMKEYRLYLTTYFETWNPTMAAIPNMCNDRIPANMRAGVPDYFKVDPSNDTLLWDVIQTIEERQEASLKAEAKPVASAKPVAVMEVKK